MSSISVATRSFTEIAQGFCSWCEGASLGDHPEGAAAGWLGKLYSAGLALPQVESNGSEGLPDIPAGALESATRNLAFFGGMYYREYFDPNPLLTEESGMGDVRDDLQDTYQDIRRGLVLFDHGQVNEAVWHWAFLHRVHWGRHAVGAMYALHCLSISRRE